MYYPWSQEVTNYMVIQKMRLVAPVIYDGDNLLANLQLQILKRKRREMEGHIDRLIALPFFGLDHTDFYNLCAVNTNSKVTFTREIKEDTQGVESSSSYSASAIPSSADWGCEEVEWDVRGWGSLSNSAICGGATAVDDTYDFFGRPNSPNNDSAASSTGSLSVFEKTRSSCGFTPISSDWGYPHEPRYASKEFATLIRKLEWNFPYAFQGNEKTVAHTQEAMHPYIEAADFLIKEARRFRSQWRLQQEQAFRSVTDARVDNADEKFHLPTADWTTILRETGERMAQPKIHRRSPLSNEVWVVGDASGNC